MYKAFSILVLTATLLISSCALMKTRQDDSRVKIGMSVKQLILSQGDPLRVTPFSQALFGGKATPYSQTVAFEYPKLTAIVVGNKVAQVSEK